MDLVNFYKATERVVSKNKVKDRDSFRKVAFNRWKTVLLSHSKGVGPPYFLT